MSTVHGELADRTAERRGVQSIEIGLRLLDALCELGGPATLKRLSDKAGMPTSKAHRYLSSFVRGEFVRQDPETGLYDLGPQALRLGLAAMSRQDVVEAAADSLRGFCDETGLTAHLCLWSDLGPIIIRTQRGRMPLASALGLGTVMPLIHSAVGKAFLAFLPRVVTLPILKRELRRAKEAAGMKTVERMIAETRARRLGRIDGGVIPGLAAVGAPVLDWQNEAACAITVVGTDPAIADLDMPVARRLDALCRRLSKANGATM